MSLQRFRRVRDDARLFHLVWNGICTVRFVVPIHKFQKVFQTIFHVFCLGTELVRHVLHEQSHIVFRIGRSLHQAQVFVSVHNPCFQLSLRLSARFVVCEHREKVQQGLQTAVRVVESPSPLLVIVSLCFARLDRQDRAYSRIR